MNLRHITLLTILSFCYCVSSVFAQEQIGKIVNINYDYKIAFVDVGGAVLSVGDVVEVAPGENSIYLQVVETSSLMARLIPVLDPSIANDKKDFSRVRIGNPVFKTSGSSTEGDSPLSNSYGDLMAIYKNLQEKEAVTAQELQKALARVQELESKASVVSEPVAPVVCEDGNVKALKEKNKALQKKLQKILNLVDRQMSKK